jgi:hypothetical protein
MRIVEEFELENITYDSTKHLMGRIFEYSTYSPFTSVNPVIHGYFTVWFNLQNNIADIEFYELLNDSIHSEEDIKNAIKSQVHDHIFEETVQETLHQFKEELTKGKFKAEIEGFNEKYAVVEIYTSWGYVVLEVDRQYNVHSFTIHTIVYESDSPSFMSAFDWQDLFFTRVHNQLRLRKLFT